MEADPRSFQAVNIGLNRVESGKARFTHNDIYTPPPVSHWRNNLTALSQRFNLYLVASDENVVVYKPDFPFQRLGRMAHLVIAPDMANPDAQGYIDRHRPHSINHLVVGDLGTEEILLIATDSGNITAYYTRSVEEAIRKEPYRFSNTATAEYGNVRPFFSEWVYESAWGLSIHTQARMLAVSANTPHHIPMDDPCAKVTVFAFALTADDEPAKEPNQDDDDSDLDRFSQWHEWDAAHHAGLPPRDKNYKITLAGFEGHDANIPSISFVNTPQDPQGKWLISTDIDGNTKIWHIWQALCHKSWNFAENNIRAGWLRRREGGWAVAALDPRCFRSVRTMEEFCGHSRAPPYHGHVGESYDITNIVRLRTPGNSHAHPLMVDTSDDSDEPVEPEDAIELWPESDDITSTDPEDLPTYQPSPNQDDIDRFQNDQTTSRSVHSPQGHSSTALVIQENRTGEDVAVAIMEDEEEDFMSLEEDDGQHESSSDGLDEGLSSTSHRSMTSLSSLAQRNSQDIEENERLLLASQNSPGETPNQNKVANTFATAKQQPWTSSSFQDPAVPDIPMLHCSASNLRLLNGPDAESPHIFCANLLKQALPPVIERNGLGNFDRLNMVHQIPDLGVVIIASQIGRCAVCTLTRNGKTRAPGLRVDWILPTRKQESKKLRPVRPLLGIAISPVQGRASCQPKSPSPEEGGTIAWGTDGVVDGVATTFDPVVLLLRNRGCKSDDDFQFSHEDEAESSSLVARRAKRKRPSYARKEADTSCHPSEFRKWTMPAQTESWASAENSRRYRLMLTYSDFTVFTYELSRGVERDDVAQREVSVFDLLD
ncbi:uncharacterized protein A1O9_02670 [Exophiala aquamarina CBS 119918]|uniref:Uncharacterized protein n=1 Tax=Exophiala aquamarina CBS 119918 TaxID=1182545 RepID=A0A072PZN4_9EURO|nr:uncharacterized protein A1O9_02670 [Exophiala aquamarina CBS 119918]KEF61105.1 hypothetical protein A1O9_02670 [Exophiala aquamarina CBS 119918]